jgi:hypothetical protein
MAPFKQSLLLSAFALLQAACDPNSSARMREQADARQAQLTAQREAQERANTLEIVNRFSTTFEKDFRGDWSDVAGKLTWARIPARLVNHPRHGRQGYAVSMPDAVDWARRWMSPAECAILQKNLPKDKVLWLGDYKCELLDATPITQAERMGGILHQAFRELGPGGDPKKLQEIQDKLDALNGGK